jgi:hypothetical protein
VTYLLTTRRSLCTAGQGPLLQPPPCFPRSSGYHLRPCFKTALCMTQQTGGSRRRKSPLSRPGQASSLPRLCPALRPACRGWIRGLQHDLGGCTGAMQQMLLHGSSAILSRCTTAHAMWMSGRGCGFVGCWLMAYRHSSKQPAPREGAQRNRGCTEDRRRKAGWKEAAGMRHRPRKEQHLGQAGAAWRTPLPLPLRAPGTH